jgi:DNA topoisomerase-1
MKVMEDHVDLKECEAQPPARYNQASLIKKLDDDGVGRPSTYKMMAQTIIDRYYTELDHKAYRLTPLGDSVIEGLELYFKDIVNPTFTKTMEEHLDEIAEHSEG